MVHRHQPLDPDTEDEKSIFNLDETQGHSYNEEDKDNHDETDKEAKIQYNHQHLSQKRKTIRLCCHKLQQKTICRHQTKIWQIQDSDENHQGDQESLEQIDQSEWDQLQALEKLCHQQREELERKTHLQGHSHNENMNFLTKNGHNETDQDDTDFEYITAILGSFTNLNTMQSHKSGKVFQNFSSGEFYKDAAIRTCQMHQAMPSKFNYKSIIKMSAPQNFSCNSIWEPDTINSEINNFKPATLNTVTLDNWNEDSVPKTQSFLDVEKINAILRTKTRKFLSAWCPFIPTSPLGTSC
jgi:hypothetical protein